MKTLIQSRTPDSFVPQGSWLLSALRCARLPPLSMSEWKRPGSSRGGVGFLRSQKRRSEQELMECWGIFTWLKASFQWGAVMMHHRGNVLCGSECGELLFNVLGGIVSRQLVIVDSPESHSNLHYLIFSLNKRELNAEYLNFHLQYLFF